MQKELRETVKYLTSHGVPVYTVQRGGKHARIIIGGKGGPACIVPRSGSDRRGIRNALRDARRLYSEHLSQHGGNHATPGRSD